MKTIKQIADELGVDKQRVYRYIRKNHINEAHQKNGVMHYDEATEMLIKQGFSENKSLHEAHHEVLQNHISDTVNEAVIEMLQNELQAKNEQIAALTEELALERQHSREQSDRLAVLADQAQKLQLVQLKPELAETDADRQAAVPTDVEKKQGVPDSGTEKKWWQFWK